MDYEWRAERLIILGDLREWANDMWDRSFAAWWHIQDAKEEDWDKKLSTRLYRSAAQRMQEEENPLGWEYSKRLFKGFADFAETEEGKHLAPLPNLYTGGTREDPIVL